MMYFSVRRLMSAEEAIPRLKSHEMTSDLEIGDGRVIQGRSHNLCDSGTDWDRIETMALHLTANPFTSTSDLDRRDGDSNS
jgi:hypothetical protein